LIDLSLTIFDILLKNIFINFNLLKLIKMDSFLNPEEIKDEKVKKCYHHLEKYSECLENTDLYFKHCYNNYFLSFIACSKLYYKLF